MNSYKKWGSLLMAAVMLMAPISVVQAKSSVPAVTIAQADEAATPPIPDKVKFHNLAAGLSYEWSEAPEASHPDNGHKLTDGKYGKLDMNDPAWVGHLRGKSREVVFDLGQEKTIGKISAHFFQDYPKNSILVPLTVSMYVSDDKKNWGLLSHNATQLLWGDGPPRQETFVWDGSRDGIKGGNTDGKMAYARYVKVIFTMHQSLWEYIDEIEIMGTDDELNGAVKVPAEPPHFLAPGEATAGIRNLNLLYNGQYDNGLGDWKKERIIPNISYVDKNGEPTDWLFDGVLYLGLASPAGRDFGVGQTILDDWKWYLNKTFAAKGDMQQLNEATVEVGTKLNQPDHKMKVVLMIPNPGEYLKNFGDVDGDGVSENFNGSDVGEARALENRQKAVQWWLDQVRQRWQAEHYSNLELVGMYWLEEQISTSSTGPDLVKAVSSKVHDMNLKFFWIPHSLAYKSYMWKDVGFDAVAYQPNYFFGGMDVDRLEDAANNAKRYGMGIEVEFDDRMLTDGVFLERYIDYLNSGVTTGLMQQGFRAYYQGNNAVYNLGVSKDPTLRLMYDWLYQYLNGTYVINNNPPPEAEVFINGKTLHDDMVVPNTETVQFTWEVKDDDGSGLTKVTAMFDGKPYTKGTPVDLAGKPGNHELVITVSAAKSKTTTYIIKAGSSVEALKTLVDRFTEQGQFTNAEAPRSLNNVLELMKRSKGTDAAQFDKYLKGFNVKLEQLAKDHIISDTAYAALKEEVYNLAGNLAENKAVTASSVEVDGPRLAPEKAVDGFSWTRWASYYEDDSWYQVDLGEAKTFDTVRIDWELARAKTYKILVSSDNQNWTSVIKDNNGIITARAGKETVRFEPVTARYVKFQGVERNTEYGYSFYEFGVYNLSGDSDITLIDGARAVVDADAKKVMIDGLVMNGSLSKVNIKVLDSEGKVRYEGQTTSTEAGSFQFTISLTGDLKGKLDAYLSMDGMSQPVKVSFEYNKPDAPTTTLTGESTVAAGEAFTVTLGLDQVSGSVYAQDLSLQYDAAAMTYVSAESILPGVSIVEKTITPEGKLRFIVASEGAAHGVLGKANVLKLTFRAKDVTAPMTGTVAVTKALVADDQGVETSIGAASLTIQVTVVTPGIPGDVNGDGKVSIGDLAIAAANYGRTSQDPNWAVIKAGDLNGDGKIDIADLAAIAKQIVK
ncbi:DUF4855 domain-containing protein [Paenibacillus guangzhouensis]|uniref:DUF4855 domain-containing protein n=1 Tax=Paenibacillus guangzhouensis TaxID=1473112 RepID=UPI0012670910|nr:DUF4855 domain-containing protein [Paenibacillus guangzhouensis]